MEHQERLKLVDEVPNDLDKQFEFKRKQSFDANSMENEDFDKLVDTPVLDYRGKEIGVKSTINRSRRKKK